MASASLAVISDRRLALVLFLVALVFRVAILLSFGHTVTDTAAYADLARHISAGDGFVAGDPVAVSVREPPGYPAFLAASFILAGTGNGLPALLAQAALDSVVSMMVFALARIVFGVPSVIGAIGALYYAINPYQSYLAAGLQSEALFTFLLTAGVAMLAVGLQQKRLTHVVTSGFLLGLATLTRSFGLGFVVLVVIVLIGQWVFQRTRERALRPLLLGIAAMAVISPWMIRNVVATGELIPIQCCTVHVFYAATFSEYDQKDEHEFWPRYYADPVVIETFSSHLTVNASNALLVRAALEKIQHDPAAYVRSRAANYPFLFVYGGDFFVERKTAFGDIIRDRDLAGLARKVGYVLLFSILPLALALLGAANRRWWSVPTFAVGGFWIYNAAVMTILWVEPRFYAPSVPFLAAWATAGLATIAARVRPTLNSRLHPA